MSPQTASAPLHDPYPHRCRNSSLGTQTLHIAEKYGQELRNATKGGFGGNTAGRRYVVALRPSNQQHRKHCHPVVFGLVALAVVSAFVEREERLLAHAHIVSKHAVQHLTTAVC